MLLILGVTEKMRLVLLIFVLFLWNSYIFAQSPEEIKFKSSYTSAIEAVERDDLTLAISHLEQANMLFPKDIEVLQLLGSIYLTQGIPSKAIFFLSSAIELTHWRQPFIIANIVEAYRQNNNPLFGLDTGLSGLSYHPKSPHILLNVANIEIELGRYNEGVTHLLTLFNIEPTNSRGWEMCARVMIEHFTIDESENFLKEVIRHNPNHHRAHFFNGLIKHSKNQLAEALDAFSKAIELNPSDPLSHANIAALYQVLGEAQLALDHYQVSIPHLPEDAGALNNYGSLLGIIGRSEEGTEYLKRALAQKPDMIEALTNLGSYCQDEGLLAEARDYFQRAARVSSPGQRRQLELRMATFLSPIATSWTAMLKERMEMEEALIRLIHAPTLGTQELETLGSFLDRIHFYLVYHGFNDRYMQELVTRAYSHSFRHSSTVLPQLLPEPVSEQRILRVGFVSKFFGLFEPHGMLLDGAMKFLPRSHYRVLALVIAGTDGKPLSPGVSEGADEIYQISLVQDFAMQQIASLEIDILLFADTLSEPLTHFLSKNRLAPIQMAYWGNPVTAASPHIDFFLSSTLLEHPLRTHIPIADEPYSEQLVLLEGQGIWYFTPIAAKEELARANFTLPAGMSFSSLNVSRANFGFEKDWFLMLCPQSTFKMHPLFDEVLAEILVASDPKAHIVLTGGRKSRWTAIYKERMLRTLSRFDVPSQPPLSSRIHFIERVSSELFIELLGLADLTLHPFPFDGSRTSADSLQAGVPFVTLPTEYLRGRMGTSFLRTMNLPELVARNRSEYVSISARLSSDPILYQSVVSKIRQRVHLIWEDLEGPYGFYQLFSRVGSSLLLDLPGSSSWVSSLPDWEGFLRQAGRDVKRETRLREERATNQQRFESVWGEERWLLHALGGVFQTVSSLFSSDPSECIQTSPPSPPAKFIEVAILETFPSSPSLYDSSSPAFVPAIFRNWNYSHSSYSSPYLPTIPPPHTSIPSPIFSSSPCFTSSFSSCHPPSSLSLSHSRQSLISPRRPSPSQFSGANLILKFTSPNSTSTFTPISNSAQASGSLPPLSSDSAVLLSLGSFSLCFDLRSQTTDETQRLGWEEEWRKTRGSVLSSSSIQFNETDQDPVDSVPVLPSVAHLYSPSIYDSLIEMRALQSHGLFAQSLALALPSGPLAPHPSSLSEDPFFLVEIGSLHFLLGNHSQAFEICSLAANMARPSPSDPFLFSPSSPPSPLLQLASTCLGVAGTYLEKGEETLKSLYFAWRDQSRSVYVDTSLPTPSTPFPPLPPLYSDSPLFTMPSVMEASLLSVEFNLVQGLLVYSQPHLCADFLATLGDLPSDPILRFFFGSFAFFSWPESKEHLLEEALERVWELRNQTTPSQPINMSTSSVLSSSSFSPLKRVSFPPQQSHLGSGSLSSSFSSDRFSLPRESRPSLVKELSRLQNVLSHVINPGFSCIDRAAKAEDQRATDYVTSLLVQSVLKRTRPEPASSEPQPPSQSEEEAGLVLMTQFFVASSPSAQRDLSEALSLNLHNPLISQVVLLTEEYLTFSGLPYPHKVKQIVVGHRLTFKEAFQFANEHLQGQLVILANADIYFDDTLSSLLPSPSSPHPKLQRRALDPNPPRPAPSLSQSPTTNRSPPPPLTYSQDVLSLLRWGEERQGFKEGDMGIRLNLRSDSQDAWIFRPPLSSYVEENSDFHLGAIRGDNRLAAVLTEAGYRVLNAPFTVHAIESNLHSQKRGSIYDTKGAAFGDVQPVFLSELDQDF